MIFENDARGKADVNMEEKTKYDLNVTTASENGQDDATNPTTKCDDKFGPLNH